MGWGKDKLVEVEELGWRRRVWGWGKDKSVAKEHGHR